MNFLTFLHMKKLPTNFFIYILFSFFWLLLIFFLMSYYKPDSNTYSRFEHIDKLIHFILFFVQSFLTSKGINSITDNLSNNYFYVTVLVLIIIGVFMEIQQVYIPYRDFDFYDLFANVIGIISGFFCSKIFNK